MEEKGRYVRIPSCSDSEHQESDILKDDAFPDDRSYETKESERGNESNQEESEDSLTSEDSVSSTTSCESIEVGSTGDVSCSQENRELPEEAGEQPRNIAEELDRMRRVIEDLSRKLSEYEKPSVSRPIVEDNWSTSHDANDRTEGNAGSSVQRSKLLFLCLGQELQGIVRAAKLKPSLTEPDCYSTFKNNIRNYLQSMTDTAAEHEAFAAMKQGPGESAIAYHARLQEKVRLCGYSPSDQERFVRAQLLKGLRNRDLSKSARIYNYDINFIVQSATREEAYDAETSQPSGSDIAIVQRSNWKRSSEPHRKRGWDGTRNDQHQSKRYRGPDRRFEERRSRCHRCNRPSHKPGTICPALDKTCNGCGDRGHFIATCPKRRINNLQRDSDRVNPSGWTDDEGEENKKQVNALSLNDVLVNCSVGSSSSITFLIDSGADVNVIGGEDWKLLKREFHQGQANLHPVQPSNGGLHPYGSQNSIKIDAAFKAKISMQGLPQQSIETLFYVAKEGRRSILSRSTSNDMGLLHVGSAVNNCEVADSLSVFPKMPGVKIKFSVDRSFAPIKNAYYNVPAAFREGARKRLQEMETRGIIERVTKAPDWISGMSAVAKGKDDFRLVVNMRGPNKAINREYYRLPLLEEMKIKLHGSSFFSKLDLSNAYYHLELCNESRDLTTFLTETGMYRFTRLMFGVNCAPEVFQREMVRILGDIRNVIVYIDDILIFAASLVDLRKTVAEVLQVLRANNLTINTKKCEFDKTRISFLGHELDSDGFHIEEAKVKSIRCFREPTTISELRSFLGLASFVSSHIPNFAEIASPLWLATTQWNWGPQQKRAFDEVKQRIIQCTIAQGFFSLHEKTILFTDASPVALGAVLIQENENHISRVISFASKALTPIERKYPQNQRDALAVIWAVEHFSYFLLGRRFTLRTDAQGVTFILNRTREDSKRALTRADGWALRLSPYVYDIEYVRGRDNIADSSSRLYNGNDPPFEEDNSPWEIASLEANVVGFLTHTEIAEETAKDETLQLLIQALKSGNWPSHLRQFQKLENDLSNRDGVVVKTGCVVVPEHLRKKALEVAHKGHPSAAKMKSILRQRVWWPKMATEAEKWVETCETCAVNGRPEKPTPMRRIFAPKTVWESIALDFNGPYIQFGGISIIVVVDYRSRYLIAKPVKSTSFHHTKPVLETIFEREGFPANIRTDNGPPFNGNEYKSYCLERGIKTIYTTPLFPQQNGLVEGYMKVINKAMSSAASNKTNFVEELREAVDAHNSAIHRVTNIAPEEIMTGRKIKRNLPLMQHENISIDNELLDQRDREAKLEAKEREDTRRNARKSRVGPGDVVIVERASRAKGETRFSPTRYTVVEEHNGNLTISNDTGIIRKRHISQTKKVHPWRKADDEQNSEHQHCHQQNQNIQHQLRPMRERNKPGYLKDYVEVVEIENSK
ncbi:uncharacterized protein K02A2.6-like [Uranotaenia lowii]|uniref:uncharacterized protein K02A2.6-like n=1 Tax=Uranotaenia lowii TaxID=190385 RepID=UPI002479976D|nr:uncharacterized protein K02A2.6-like [Uranotaenia lowii]